MEASLFLGLPAVENLASEEVLYWKGHTQWLDYVVRTEGNAVHEPFQTLQERFAWIFQYTQICTFFSEKQNKTRFHDFYQSHKECPTIQTKSVHLLASDTLTHGSHREHKRQQLCAVSSNVVFTTLLLRLEPHGKSPPLRSY